MTEKKTFPLLFFPPAVFIVKQKQIPAARPPAEPVSPQTKIVSVYWLFYPIIFCFLLVFINIISDYKFFNGFLGLLLIGLSIPLAYFLFYLPQQRFVNEQNIERQQIYKEKLKEYRYQLQLYQSKKNKIIPDAERQLFYQNELQIALNQAVRKPTKLSRAVQKGRSEEQFYLALVAHFGKSFIKTNLQLGKFALPFVPDFCYIDQEKSIYIDIEIDEPYSIMSKEPIHFLGADDNRNDFFISQGWAIIRFAEEQIIKYPQSCCTTISNMINYLLSKTEKPEITVPLLACWTKKEAIEMAKNEHRQYYKN